MTSFLPRLLVAPAALAGLLCTAAGVSAQVDPVAHARQLARSGQPAQAVTLLAARLAATPQDADARTLRGIVLGWLGRYGEAKEELQRVLAGGPARLDALAALARIELWDGHPEEAERLAATGHESHAGDAELLEVLALAQEAQGRMRDALSQINLALDREPARESALQIRRRLIDRQPAWIAHVAHRYDRFNDDRAGWQETQLALTRRSAFGTFGLRAYEARRFGEQDGQVEAEMYPRLGAGTYAYVAAAVATRATVYPRARFAADLYHTVGGGWEVGGGARDLRYSPTAARVYMTSLSKYAGRWLYSGRAWITPAPGRRDVTIDVTTRRYGADGESYWSVRYARGSYRDELLRLGPPRLHSDAVGLSWQRRLGRLAAQLDVTTSRDQRPAGGFVWQTTMAAGARVRF